MQPEIGGALPSARYYRRITRRLGLATAAQLKQITRPLLELDPRFVLVKRWLVIRPVGHWLHGYFLDRRSGKGVFVVQASVIPLYFKRRITPHWDVHPPPSAGTPGGWHATTPYVDRHLIEIMAGSASDAVTRYDSPDKFLALLHREVGVWEQKIHTLALAGRLRHAIRFAEKLIVRYRNPPGGYAPYFKHIRRLQRLIAVFRGGQARTNRLLRTFEWINVRRLGVEQWWTWTPIAM